MIDDELLQELLGKASALYNNGEYRSAIDAWKEALRVDPGSQKAREGIQMATLLLAGCEGGIEVIEETEPAPPDDGGRPRTEGLSRAELDTLLDQGIGRVRALLDERKYSEAVEGARRLVPMDPDSEEVQRLVEEAQQAFEAAPFIEEHLTLARELASQERFEEAETECRKVFALDRANPEAHALVADLRRRARAVHPAVPAVEPPDLGGATIKMDLSQLMGAPAPGESADRSEPAPPEQGGEDAAPSPQAAAEAGARALRDEPLAEPLPADMFDFELDLGRAESLVEEPATHAARGPEEVAASGETAIGAPADAGSGEEGEIVDAETIVPPSVRVAPRTAGAPSGAESWVDTLGAAEPAPPAPETAAAEPRDWERELESLNLKTGEHDILGRSAARAPAAPPQDIDSDLSAFLEEDLGPQAAGAGAAEEQRPEAPPAASRIVEARDLTPRARPAPRDAADETPPWARPRRSVPIYFGLLGVVLLAAGGTAWWLFFLPKTATGVAPAAETPPSASSGEKPEADHGPIPTPIGSTSKEPVKPPPAGGEGGAGVAGGAAAVAPAPVASPPEAVAAPAPAEPPPRPMTPEQRRSEVARRMSEGRRLLAAGQWREARDEFAAVLSLDPVNFECKELLDQAQERVNRETKVRQDLEEARSAFEEKSYQTCLWKLYRLPRDAGLGDIDLYIRNAWFNWAVLGLKNGDASNAAQKLAETLSTDPNDDEAEKLQEVATRYASRPKDRLYYSFVDTLKYRAFDQK